MPDITLRVGITHEISLRGLGGAGYSWVPGLEGNGGVVRIERVIPPPVERPPSGGLPPAATSVPEVFAVRALAPGNVVARFELRRPWETTGPPLETRRIEIKVVG